MSKPSFFSFVGGTFCAENVSTDEIVSQYGTPVYIYSQTAIENNFATFDDAFGKHPHLIHHKDHPASQHLHAIDLHNFRLRSFQALGY